MTAIAETSVMCAGDCGAVITSGSTLCPPCTDVVLEQVRRAHDLLRDLEITLTRQDRVTPSAVGGKSTETPLPFAVGATEIARELRATVRAMAMAGEMTPGLVRRFRAAYQRALERVDIPQVQLFVTECTECTLPTWLYVRGDITEATCHRCGAIYDVAESRAWHIRALPAELALARGTVADLSTLMKKQGLDVGVSTLRRWAAKGRITVVSRTSKGWPQYRLRDAVHTFQRLHGVPVAEEEVSG